MANWFNRLQEMFSKGLPITPIPAGIYHFQSEAEKEDHYRLHLRLDPDGKGILIINAHTTLHLNQTAAEFAYYIIQEYSEEQTLDEITRRYNIKKETARNDFLGLQDKIQTLIDAVDIDPVTYMDIDRLDPYNSDITAPYRLDCALTYRTSGSETAGAAPLERVKRELMTPEWKDLLSRAWAAGIPHIIFTGGEPTLRPDLPELVSHCQALGQVTGLLTDGYRLSKKDYLHQLLNEGLDHIMILLDPKDEHSWEAIRDVLAEDIFLTVHLTLTSSDTSLPTSAMDRLEKMGIKNVSLTAQTSSLKPALDECVNTAVARGLSLVTDIPVPYSAFNSFSLEMEEEVAKTGAGSAYLYVEPDGDVLPSQGVNHVMGNFLTDDWNKIWENRIQHQKEQ